MQSIAFRPPSLELPSGDLESDSCQQLGRRLEAVFREAAPSAMLPVITWLKGSPVRHQDLGLFQLDDLIHELSEYLAPAATDVFVDGRSLAEYRLMEAFLPIRSVAGFSTFCDTLMQLGCRVCGREVGFRRTGISTVADRQGQQVAYPSPEYIRPSLMHLHDYCMPRVPETPGIAAVALMVGLTRLHPFMDGNGRVARILFNAILNEGKEQPVYLPLYELAALSRCGFLLRLRQAQYHGEWQPLLTYLVHVAGTLWSEKVG